MNKYSLLLALGLGLAGCARKAVPTVSTAGPGTSTSAMEPALPSVKAQNTAFDFLSIKAKAQVTLKGNKQNANLSVRVRRDSVIWVSAGLAGFEGVRAVLTRDSVRVVNRLEKTYFSGGYDYLTKLLNVPVSFDQMQTLLLGDYLPAPTGTKPTVATEEAARQRVSYNLSSVLVEHLLQAGNTGRVQQLRLSDEATDIKDAESQGKFVGHMTSDDFFGVEKFPTSTFKIVSVTPIKGAAKTADNATITGDMTIKGVTQRISFPAKVGVKDGVAAATGKMTIDRTKFGLKYGSKSFFESIGDKAIYDTFDLTFNVIAKKA